MAVLHSFPAKRCWTVAGFLIHDHKILMVKHKKLGLWLAPGGHVETDELPHEAAEREVREETGLQVKAISAVPNPETDVSENLPHPFLTNLHWVSRENYEGRTQGASRSDKTQRDWGKGCEQHLCFMYLVAPQGSLDFFQNEEETDGIGWFSLEEIAELETALDVKAEVRRAFELKESLNV